MLYEVITEIFNFLGVNVFTATDNHILDTTGDGEIAILVHDAYSYNFV